MKAFVCRFQSVNCLGVWRLMLLYPPVLNFPLLVDCGCTGKRQRVFHRVLSRLHAHKGKFKFLSHSPRSTRQRSLQAHLPINLHDTKYICCNNSFHLVRAGFNVGLHGLGDKVLDDLFVVWVGWVWARGSARTCACHVKQFFASGDGPRRTESSR